MSLFVLLAEGACLPATADPAGGEPSVQSIRLEPDGDFAAAPTVLRVHMRGDGLSADDVFLVHGDVGSAHLGQFAKGEVSATLSERIVPAVAWHDGDDDGAVVLAPRVVLTPGETYNVVVGQARETQPLIVMMHDPLPLVPVIWHTQSLAVWCGERRWPPFALPSQIEPSHLDTVIASGVPPLGTGERCVHMPIPESVGASPVVAPPVLVGPEGWPFARLEPLSDLTVGEATHDPPPMVPLVCALGTLPMGGACVTEVADDRMRMDLPRGEVLWQIADGLSLDFVQPANAGGSFLVSPLTPGVPTDLRWGTVDALGRIQSGNTRIYTHPPMAHLVISEVLANPVGPEPSQEYVELYNDGLAPGNLGDFVLEDIGGVTHLPGGIVLMPGRYALIVNQDYDATGEYDPAAVEGTLTVRVEQLGKGGLKNDGEPLKLVRRDGVSVSRFPPLPKPKAGLSVHRTSPRVLHDDDDGFIRADPTPGGPAPAPDGVDP